MAPIEFTGDVDATSSASVSTKGGSLTTTLKKPIREKLGDVASGQLSAATLSFGTEASVVLLGTGIDGACRVRVSRVAKNRFEIELDDGDDDTVDDLTAAFLTLKAQQFKEGAMALRGPYTADEWLAEIDEAARQAEEKHETAAVETSTVGALAEG